MGFISRQLLPPAIPYGMHIKKRSRESRLSLAGEKAAGIGRPFNAFRNGSVIIHFIFN